VPVGVDQARHQRAASTVDRGDVGGVVERDGTGRDFLDLVSAHQHIRRFRKYVCLAIEDTHILKKHRGLRVVLLGLRFSDVRKESSQQRRERNDLYARGHFFTR
jgi:hypothetical protein